MNHTNALALIDAVKDAGNDFTMHVSLIVDDDELPALWIKMGEDNHTITPDEARRLADAFEATMNQNPDEPEVRKWPNIIMGLRAACDKVEAGLVT